MSIKRFGVGPRMSMGVAYGGTVYLAGHVAKESAGKSVGEQTADILAQIDAVLAEAGTDKTNLLSANIWLTDMATFPEMNAVWDAWVSPGNTPARATVQAALAAPQYTVEIMVTAAIPGAMAATASAGKMKKGKAAKKAATKKAAAKKAPAKKAAAKKAPAKKAASKKAPAKKAAPKKKPRGKK
jgi:enamine deaminase RidA (YjgF/YER057c/UK114 family)